MGLEPDLDDRVRRALDPGAVVTDRMVAAALRGGSASDSRPFRAWRLALAGTAVVVCVLWVALYRLAPSAPPDDLVITRAGEVVMYQNASGETWILGPDAAPDPTKAGTGFVIVEGDSK